MLPQTLAPGTHHLLLSRSHSLTAKATTKWLASGFANANLKEALPTSMGQTLRDTFVSPLTTKGDKSLVLGPGASKGMWDFPGFGDF